MKFSASKYTSTVKTTARDRMIRRQSVNFERFMQEKADVFQVTEPKVQAVFWTMQTRHM